MQKLWWDCLLTLLISLNSTFLWRDSLLLYLSYDDEINNNNNSSLYNSLTVHSYEFILQLSL